MIDKKGIFESFFYQINKKYLGIQIRLSPVSMEKGSKVMNIGMTHSINKSIPKPNHFHGAVVSWGQEGQAPPFQISQKYIINCPPDFRSFLQHCFPYSILLTLVLVAAVFD